MTNEMTFGNRDIADLLPWYVTGRLSKEDQARVEAALATDAALREELRLVREEQEEAIAFNEGLGVPSRRATERFMAALEASPRKATRFDLVRFVANQLEALRPRTLAFGAMAACAVVFLQAAVISHLATKQRGGATYESASIHVESTQTGPVLLVAFTANARAAAIQKLLEDNSLAIVAGPAAGFFSVRVETKSAPDIKAVIATLNHHKDVVRSVMLQSPPD